MGHNSSFPFKSRFQDNCLSCTRIQFMHLLNLLNFIKQRTKTNYPGGQFLSHLGLLTKTINFQHNYPTKTILSG